MDKSIHLINDNDWWDYTKVAMNHKIQWTPQCGGWVRARRDRCTKWEYKKCGNASCALSTGDRIIENQIDNKKR